MFCKKCGKELENGIKFCSNCGNEVDVKSEDSTEVLSCESKDKLDKSTILFFIMIGVAIVCLVGGYIFSEYYKNTLKYTIDEKKNPIVERLKDYEFTNVQFSNRNESIKIEYYNEETPIIINSTSGSQAYSYFPAVYELSDYGVNTYSVSSNKDCNGLLGVGDGTGLFPLNDKKVIEKELFSDVVENISELQRVNKKENSEYELGKLNKEGYDSLSSIYEYLNELVYEFGEMPTSLDNISINITKDALKVHLNGDITLVCTKSTKDDMYSTVKERVLSGYDANYLEGEYNQEGTGTKLIIDGSELVIDDNFYVYRNITLDGEERQVHYYDVLYVDNGCTFEGNTYTLDKDYVSLKEAEKELNAIEYYLLNEKMKVGNGTITFNEFYIGEDYKIYGFSDRGAFIASYSGGDVLTIQQCNVLNPPVLHLLVHKKKNEYMYHEFY